MLAFTSDPTMEPTAQPTTQSMSPTAKPSRSPLPRNQTYGPTMEPTLNPSKKPSQSPSFTPTEPSNQPTIDPTKDPTLEPTYRPSKSPLPGNQTHEPTFYPSNNPTPNPTFAPTSQFVQCLNNGREIHAWYDGLSIDLANNLWMDKSGNNNHGDIVNNTGIELFDGTDISNTELYLNGQSIVTGTYQTKITFNVELNPVTHTVFNLAKYRNTASYKGRILQSSIYNSLFGFGGSKSGVAFYTYWITAQNDRFGTEWVLSTQQQKLYRGNAIDLTVTGTPHSGLTNTEKLMINSGKYGFWTSDFALSESIVFNEILDLWEIECIEYYFNDRYLLSFTNNPTLPSISPTMRPTDQPTLEPTDRPSRSPLSGNETHAPSLYPSSNPTPTPQFIQCLNNGREIHAWYDGSSIDLANNSWIDKSGNNNHGEIVVDTGIELFDGTDTSNTELYLNGQPIVTGTYQTKITFNIELNPVTHTVFNLAKYRIGSGYKARILQTQYYPNSLFGFWGGRSGIAYYNYWITAYDDKFGTEWVLSTQQEQLYRGNAMDLTVNTQSSGVRTANKLMINNGYYASAGEASDFALSELIVFNEILDLGEIECIENYFNDRYLLSFTNNPTLPSISPTVRPSRSPATMKPSISPLPANQTRIPTLYPSKEPSQSPSFAPTEPTEQPTIDPTNDPTLEPTYKPSKSPLTGNRTHSPTLEPTIEPTGGPTTNPTLEPSEPTIGPTTNPTLEPTTDPTMQPTYSCSSHARLDILFGVDTSGSIGFDGFQMQKQFIEDIVTQQINIKTSRIGFFTFATYLNKTRHIQLWNTTDELSLFTRGLWWSGGWTATRYFFEEGLKEFANTNHSDRQPVLFIITDGYPCLPDSQGGCPQSLCDHSDLAESIEQEGNLSYLEPINTMYLLLCTYTGIKVVIVCIGDAIEYGSSWLDCFRFNKGRWIQVAEYSPTSFDAVKDKTHTVLCPTGIPTIPTIQPTSEPTYHFEQSCTSNTRMDILFAIEISPSWAGLLAVKSYIYDILINSINLEASRIGLFTFMNLPSELIIS